MKYLSIVVALFFSSCLSAQSGAVSFEKEWVSGEERRFLLSLHAVVTGKNGVEMDSTLRESLAIKVLDASADSLTVQILRENQVATGLAVLQGDLSSDWDGLRKIAFDVRLCKRSGEVKLLHPERADSLIERSIVLARELLADDHRAEALAFLQELSKQKSGSESMTKEADELLGTLRLVLYQSFTVGDTVTVSKVQSNPLNLPGFPELNRKMYLIRQGKRNQPSEVMATVQFDKALFAKMLAGLGQQTSTLMEGLTGMVEGADASGAAGSDRGDVSAKSMVGELNTMLLSLLESSGLSFSETIRIRQAEDDAWPAEVDKSTVIDLPGMSQSISMQVQIRPE
ncbi:MAG: hypothetical protein AB7C90_05985 [Bacteroidales bacterium]